MEKIEFERKQLINEFMKVAHGDLAIYTDSGIKASFNDPELLAHFIAWNQINGEVHDSKNAFPILALRGEKDPELYENAVAHLCLLDPRNLVKALRFNKQLNSNLGTEDIFYSQKYGAGTELKRGIQLYLRVRETERGWWYRTAVQHRKSLKTLYAMNHIRPASFAQKILFGVPTGKMKIGINGREKPEIGSVEYPVGSVFEKIKELKNMGPQEAAGTILINKIPFLIAVGALGGIKDKPDIILALMEQMSGNELINNTKTLKKWGVFESPLLKSGYDAASRKAKDDKKVSTLKASRAMEAIDDKKVVAKLENIQEHKLKQLGGIDGDWLVLGDQSGSMHQSIEAAKQVAALIAQQVKGQVHLVFFDDVPTYFDVTGKSLSEIKEITKRIEPRGATSIGCGLDLIASKGFIVNGIAICSDGGENTRPLFTEVYKKYAEKTGIEPTVYHYWLPGEADAFSHYCKQGGVDVQKFDISEDVDFYSLPNLIKSMRTSKYTLIEEIMETELLTFNKVFGLGLPK